MSPVTPLVKYVAELRNCFPPEDPEGLAFDLDLRAPLVPCKTWQHPSGENIPPCIFLTHLSVGAICLSNLPKHEWMAVLTSLTIQIESSNDEANDAMISSAW